MSELALPKSSVNGQRFPEATFAESIIDTMRDPLLVLDGSLHVVLASREFYRTFGVTREETEGRLVYQLGNNQWNIPHLRTLLEEILPEHATFRDFEVEHVFETIGRKVMLLNARRLHQGPGGAENILLVIEDATARRDAEDARREAETRFTEMVKNVRDHSIFLTDPAGVITSWNVAAERVMGFTEAEAVGRHFSLIFTPEDVGNGVPAWELETARDAGRAEDERWHVRKGGERFWALGIITPLRDDKEALTGFSKILRDITERKRAEDALRDSNERIGTLVALMPAAVYTCDAEGRLTFYNRRAAELWGREPRLGDDQEKFCGSFRLWAPDGRPVAHAECPMADAVRDGRSARGLEVVVERPDGSRAVVRVNIDPLSDHEGRPAGAINVFEDVTDRKRAEAALRESEERLRVALAAGQMGTWLWRIPQDEQVIDDGLRRLMGLPPGAEVMNLGAFLQAVHEDDRARAQAEFERCLGGGEFNVEFRVTWPDGSTHWLRDQGKTFADPEGCPLFMAGAAVDITDRRRMEEDLRDADRRKDDFLALLAHELRNPLAPIRNALQVIRLSPDRAARERSQAMMDRQLTHMVRLIDDLLDISRINRDKMELRLARITLADALSGAIETARPVIEAAGHELTTNLPAEPITLEADQTRLAQVFSNLLANSAKYTEPGGRISLSARRDGAEVVVTVADTGIGIPAEALPRIFDMFSQVDRSIERTTGGLGIGLALVKGLVEMHGGTVAAASAGQGNGSEFTVRLPVVPDRVADAPAGQKGAASVPVCRILVVDDNRDSAESMADMLRMIGNEIAVAHDGLEAVEQAMAFRPDVVLMDVGMPRLNGYEATRRIREQPWGRDIAIIALTGWGQDADRARTREAGCDGHLVKPVSLDDLTRLLSGLNGKAVRR